MYIKFLTDCHSSINTHSFPISDFSFFLCNFHTFPQSLQMNNLNFLAVLLEEIQSKTVFFFSGIHHFFFLSHCLTNIYFDLGKVVELRVVNFIPFKSKRILK